MQCQSAEQREHGIALTVVAQTAKKNRGKVKKLPITWCPNKFRMKQNLKFAINSNAEFSQKKFQIEGRSVRLAKLYIKFRDFFLNFDFLSYLYPELVGKPLRFFMYQK